MEFSNLSIEQLIDGKEFACDCGKKHIAKGLRSIKIGKGVINELPTVLSAFKIQKPFIVTDCNEYRSAGEKVEEILRQANIPYSLHIIPSEGNKRIAPSEFATGSIALNFDVTCDAILCVGSGVMNDLCKVMSNITGRPSVVVATAPSMDGYASDSAAMEVNNIKLTLKEVIPVALICDTDIMSQAPIHMLHAGLGDMIGKYSALGEAINLQIETVEKSFIDLFYNQETGLYCDSAKKAHSAVHSNVLPLLFDIGIDEGKKERIVQYICQKKLTSMGVYMAYFALSALVKCGEREKAERLATDEGAWLNMLAEGATTTFEAWGKAQKWNTSLFHPWATAPLIVFAKSIEVY